MATINDKIQIYQTADPLESAKQFLINKKDVDILKIEDLRSGEEFEKKFIVVCKKKIKNIFEIYVNDNFFIL